MKFPKHHYIPVFYLKKWRGAKGVLCEFSRPYNHIVPRRGSPDSMGYERGLYKIEGVKIEFENNLEEVFFKPTDDKAAKVLHLILNDEIKILSQKDRYSWSRFILSLLLRTPKFIEQTTQKIDAYVDQLNHKDLVGKTYQEYGLLKAQHVQDIIQSDKVLNLIMSMKWFIVNAIKCSSKIDLLTSDRPIITTNGLGYSYSHLVMPVSPNHLFCAVNEESERQKLIDVFDKNNIYKLVNEHVVRQARKYVYGTDDSQQLFVSRRFGALKFGSIMEDI